MSFDVEAFRKKLEERRDSYHCEPNVIAMQEALDLLPDQPLEDLVVECSAVSGNTLIVERAEGACCALVFHSKCREITMSIHVDTKGAIEVIDRLTLLLEEPVAPGN